MLDTILLILTFPGVMAHEMSHEFFCKKSGVAVKKKCYFRIGDPAGYIVTESAKKYEQALSITVGPFLINTILSLISFFVAFLIIISRDSFSGIFSIIFLWLGFSFALHAFPSAEDANILWGFSNKNWKTALWAPISFPIVLVIKMANIMRYLGFDVFYALALGGFAAFFADIAIKNGII